MPKPKLVSDHSKLDNKSLFEWSGWMFTDAVAAMDCPKCGAKFGLNCKTPKGRKAWPPHGERTARLAEAGYGANKVR
jgi:hypothetical protein